MSKLTDEQAYEAGIRKLGFHDYTTCIDSHRDEYLHCPTMGYHVMADLRKDDGFAWRVAEKIEPEWLLYLVRMPPGPQRAAALYRAVCALGRSGDANT